MHAVKGEGGHREMSNMRQRWPDSEVVRACSKGLVLSCTYMDHTNFQSTAVTLQVLHCTQKLTTFYPISLAFLAVSQWYIFRTLLHNYIITTCNYMLQYEYSV